MFNFQLNASKLAGPFCMCHLAHYAYPLAEKLSMYATVKVSSERCSTKGPTKMVGSAQRVTSTPRTINDYHWRSRFVLHVISKLTFCIPSTVKRGDKETPDCIDWITTVYFGFTWFLSYLRGSNLCSSYEGRGISAPWQDHNGGDANIDEAHTRRPGAKIKLRASATGIHKNRMGGSTMMWVRSTWLCTVHAEWNARLALAGGGVKMF